MCDFMVFVLLCYKNATGRIVSNYKSINFSKEFKGKKEVLFINYQKMVFCRLTFFTYILYLSDIAMFIYIGCILFITASYILCIPYNLLTSVTVF